MTKRLIDIDDDLLDAAQEALATSGVSDTVRTALRLAADQATRAGEIEWLIKGGLASMAEPAERDSVWR